MGLPTFPFSPLFAAMTREFDWNENKNVYDSGDQQGSTNWAKPLYKYTMNISLYNQIKQSSLWAFWNLQTKGMTKPFLIKDPYDNYVSSVIVAGNAATNAATGYIYDTNSFSIRADTTTISTLTSALSGFVTLGHEYSYLQDTGIFTVNTKVTSDVWTAHSVSYWRKVTFSKKMTEAQILWGTFTTALTFDELP